MPPRARKAIPSHIFQLRVTLEHVEPPIWRRLLVPGNITLSELHRVLNEAMGWTNSHLHQFEFHDRRIFGDPSLRDDPPRGSRTSGGSGSASSSAEEGS